MSSIHCTSVSISSQFKCKTYCLTRKRFKLLLLVRAASRLSVGTC